VFYGSGLVSVWIGNGVTAIQDQAFNFCAGLSFVSLGTNIASIGGGAFEDCWSLTSITFPPDVSSIGRSVFELLYNLKEVYFEGNAPPYPYNFSAFWNDYRATIYYLPEASGWGPTFDGIPTSIWLPQILSANGTYGIQSNQFGFTITWASGKAVVVDACTNLLNPVWQPVQTNILTGVTSYFSDSQWTNYPSRFYRLRSP
jgi:hypothetical protein